MQSAAAAVVAANSVPCLHPLLPTLRLRSNLFLSYTSKCQSHVHKSGLSSSSLPLLLSASWFQLPCCRCIPGSSGRFLSWAAEARSGCTTGRAVVGSLRYSHVSSTKAYYFLDVLMNSSTAFPLSNWSGQYGLFMLCI